MAHFGFGDQFQVSTEDARAKTSQQERKSNVEGDGNEGKTGLEEGKKQDEVNSESLKSEKAASPSREKTETSILHKVASSSLEEVETIQNKLDNQEVKRNVEGDGDKGKVDLEEGKKKDEVGADISTDKVFEREKKASHPPDVSDRIQEKPDDKVGNEGDGEEKEKADQEDGKKHDEVEAKISKSNNDVEGVKKASPARKSTEAIQNKPDDHGIGDKHDEKDNLEGKKKDEVIADSSKSDKVIEESKETIQSKPDDHRENKKLKEKGDKEKNRDNLKMVDQGEAKTLKSHKTSKFGKILSFSGKSKALFQKKQDDLKGDNTMAEENYETPSPSRPTTDSRSNQSNWFKEWRRGNLEYLPAIGHTPKLPSTLKNLELECFPEEDPPEWLNPKDLNSLEKLYIKGGWLSQISDDDITAENKRTVQILRLKYLHNFEVKWKDLQTMFPKMTLLEKYECPKISFCPTDGNSVWRKP